MLLKLLEIKPKNWAGVKPSVKRIAPNYFGQFSNFPISQSNETIFEIENNELAINQLLILF